MSDSVETEIAYKLISAAERIAEWHCILRNNIKLS